jgi:hypothetical protein
VADLDRDRLRRLTERLDVAAQRAERLLSESVLAAATAPPPEPRSPDYSPGPPEPRSPDCSPGAPEPRSPDYGPGPPEPRAPDYSPPPPEPRSPDHDPGRPEPEALRARSDGADGEPQRPPPSGWRQAQRDDRSDRDRWLDSDELELLLTVLAGIRDRIPTELRRRLAEAIRELLMALRAVIDWYLERTDRPAQASADVEDIPIL